MNQLADRFRNVYNVVSDMGNHKKSKIDGLPGEISIWAGIDRPPISIHPTSLRTLGYCSLSLDDDGGTEVYTSMKLYEKPDGTIVACDTVDVVTPPTDLAARVHVKSYDGRIPEAHQTMAAVSAIETIEMVAGIAIPKQAAPQPSVS